MQPSSGSRWAQPVAPHFLGKARRRRRAFAQVRDQQRVATHFAVVVHAVLRVFGREIRPVAPLAQQQQPVVAQAVLLVGARDSGRKNPGLPAAWPCPGGFSAPNTRPRAPVRGRAPRQQLREPVPVALAKRLMHFQDQIVGLGLGLGLAGRRSATISVRILRNFIWGIMDKSQEKRALRKQLVEQRLNMPDRTTSLRLAAAGHAHLAGQPPRHRDRRVLADQGRVRSAAGPAPLEGRRRIAGRAAAAAHRLARGRQAASGR